MLIKKKHETSYNLPPFFNNKRELKKALYYASLMLICSALSNKLANLLDSFFDKSNKKSRRTKVLF